MIVQTITFRCANTSRNISRFRGAACASLARAGSTTNKPISAAISAWCCREVARAAPAERRGHGHDDHWPQKIPKQSVRSSALPPWPNRGALDAPLRRSMSDRSAVRFRHAHDQTRAKKECERYCYPGKQRGARKYHRAHDQDHLAFPQQVGNASEKHPMSARAAAESPHHRIGKIKFRLNERHHEIQRVTIKKDHSEIQAQ